jgi:hypothetical protein
MLEIKCPMNRDILMDPDALEVYGAHGEPITNLIKDSKKGICPTYYWAQVQLQLQDCGLKECDFWQCKIVEYADKEDFIDDTDLTHPWLSAQSGHEKGVVIQLIPADQLNNKTMEYDNRIWNFASFIYQPRVDMTPAEIDQWICNTLSNLRTTHKGMMFERVFYWKIIESRNITIKRDDKWFADSLETFRTMWDYILYLRENKDKAILLKRYINIFPTDRWKKIIDKKGLIMKAIETICSELCGNSSNKAHKEYAAFIAKIEKDIDDSNVDQPKDYDVDEDVTYIKDALDLNIPDDLDEKEKEEFKKKYTEFIKQTKANVDSFIFAEKN